MKKIPVNYLFTIILAICIVIFCIEYISKQNIMILEIRDGERKLLLNEEIPEVVPVFTTEDINAISTYYKIATTIKMPYGDIYVSSEPFILTDTPQDKIIRNEDIICNKEVYTVKRKK